MESPASVLYSEDSHGVPGASMKNPEYVSAQRRCLNQCSKPTHDLKDTYPSLPQKKYSANKVAAILTATQSSPINMLQFSEKKP